MAYLAFKTTKETKTVVIEDGQGTSIELPKYGCLTPDETFIFAEEHWATFEQSNGNGKGVILKRPFEIYKAEIVKRLLISRLKLTVKKGITLTELFSSDEGEPVAGEAMTDALYEFFQNEKLQWRNPEEVGKEVKATKKK